MNACENGLAQPVGVLDAFVEAAASRAVTASQPLPQAFPKCANTSGSSVNDATGLGRPARSFPDRGRRSGRPRPDAPRATAGWRPHCRRRHADRVRIAGEQPDPIEDAHRRRISPRTIRLGADRKSARDELVVSASETGAQRLDASRVAPHGVRTGAATGLGGGEGRCEARSLFRGAPSVQPPWAARAAPVRGA